MGEWSEWSDCVSDRQFSNAKQLLFSYAMEATTEWDSGRETMQEIMKQKLKSWHDIDTCKADGSCPSSLTMRPISGAFHCNGGLTFTIYYNIFANWTKITLFVRVKFCILVLCGKYYNMNENTVCLTTYQCKQIGVTAKLLDISKV